MNLRLGTLGLALYAAVSSIGCPESIGTTSYAEKTRNENAAVALGGASLPDHYFGITATKTANTGEFFATFPIDVWLPFDVEISGGMFDPQHGNLDGGSFDVDLVTPDHFDPNFEAHEFTVEPAIGGGLMVTAGSTKAPGFTVGTHTFAGAAELDFRITGNGTTLEFFCRAKGDAMYTSLGSFPYVAQGTKLALGVGVIDLGHKAVVGFDHANLLANGTPPGVPSAEEAAANAIRAAGLRQLDAFYAVDGPTPDLATAATALDEGLTLLETAQDAVAALPSSGTQKKVKDLLASAKKSLKSAIKKVADDKAKPAYTKLKKALKDQYIAVEKLDPP